MNPVCALSAMPEQDLQSYGLHQRAWSQFEYRVELSRRCASTFDADHLIIFDDVAMVTGESERLLSLSAIQGCDRSLLPALWLSIGFDCGVTILVYAPPNPIELRELLVVRKKFADKLQRPLTMRILFNGVNDILALYERSPDEYTALCLKYMTTPTFRPTFSSEYHVEQLKISLDDICQRVQNKRRSLVFPFEVTPYHVRELGNDTRLILPDLPNNDKAYHNFLLRDLGFTKLPRLLMVCVDGTVVASYEVYKTTMGSLTSLDTENTPANVERFASAIVLAVDRLRSQHGLDAFVKLDAAGAGGWSCMSPAQHPVLYNCDLSQTERLAYVIDYITRNVIDQHLPTHAVVEEFIQAESRPGSIAADYTVCGMLLHGKFFPTSINLCGTDNAGQYVEQWTAARAPFLDDDDQDWQAMFETYKEMSEYESGILNYFKGIYAGDLFISVINRQHKQRDWNIRRGGRSTPETLSMINEYEVNYECKIAIDITAFQLTNEQIFYLYTRVCDELSHGHYKMYPFATSYVYFGQSEDRTALKFDLVLNPRLLTDAQQKSLPKCQHQEKVYEIVNEIVSKHVLVFSNSEGK